MSSPLASIKFLPLGAIIQSIAINGKEIVQGFPTTDDYIQHNGPYFGETIGRVANRISNARIENLNGRSYQLVANNGPNSLHGGPRGWGKQVWKGENVTRNGRDAVLFTYTSPDGDEGFPGTVAVSVWYTPYEEKSASGTTVTVLEIEYEAELLDGDVEETVISMTNHSYFNLSQTASIDGTEVTLASEKYLEVGEDGIPSGNIKPYRGVQANEPFTLGAVDPDIDDCFILVGDENNDNNNNDNNGEVKVESTDQLASSSSHLDTRSQPLRLLVTAHHPSTSLNLQVFSTEPAFQFYTGKYIDVPELRGGEVPRRGARSGFCVEPSRYVNAVNEPRWKPQTVLKRKANAKTAEAENNANTDKNNVVGSGAATAAAAAAREGDCRKYGQRTVYRAWEGPKAAASDTL